MTFIVFVVTVVRRYACQLFFYVSMVEFIKWVRLTIVVEFGGAESSNFN